MNKLQATLATLAIVTGLHTKAQTATQNYQKEIQTVVTTTPSTMSSSSENEPVVKDISGWISLGTVEKVIGKKTIEVRHYRSPAEPLVASVVKPEDRNYFVGGYTVENAERKTEDQRSGGSQNDAKHNTDRTGVRYARVYNISNTSGSGQSKYIHLLPGGENIGRAIDNQTQAVGNPDHANNYVGHETRKDPRDPNGKGYTSPTIIVTDSPDDDNNFVDFEDIKKTLQEKTTLKLSRVMKLPSFFAGEGTGRMQNPEPKIVGPDEITNYEALQTGDNVYAELFDRNGKKIFHRAKIQIDNAQTAPTDSDNDGVADTQDACPNTPAGETVDAKGCANSQKDSDGDGVKDDVDCAPDDANYSTSRTWYKGIDKDGDGHIGSVIDFDACRQPTGYSATKPEVTDCDDANASIYPGATEVPGNGIDEDCDGKDGKKKPDMDGDGIPDDQDTDKDGDGVNNNQDAFPSDPNESLDTDGDGIGNNADNDDDNDGYSDDTEKKAGTNPLNPNDKPKEKPKTIYKLESYTVPSCMEKGRSPEDGCDMPGSITFSSNSPEDNGKQRKLYNTKGKLIETTTFKDQTLTFKKITYIGLYTIEKADGTKKELTIK